MNELIEDMGHIGEVTRMLQVFLTTGTRNLSEKEIAVITNQTAGQTSRYPRPRAALRFSKQMGLVRYTKNGYHLSPLGIQYIQSGKSAEATLYQNKLLLGLLLDNPDMRVRISDFFANAHGTPRIQVLQVSLTTASLKNTARLLQQVGCIEYRDGSFHLVRVFENTVDNLICNRAVLNEQDLWKRLEAQRLRGVFVEERVIESEQDRLRTAGCENLADAVTRASALDTGAGYDIASFELNGTPRYIEVKSSVGRKVEFEWSEHERSVAERLGTNYWIYFVPFAHLIRDDIGYLIRIRDPIRKLKSHQLWRRASGWHIFASEEATSKINPKIDGRQKFDW